mmetsp:Transcript_25031/g.77270  ORF Transcript_25031/g.77270 Transcript_25031/m.77270 type:complete len:268 (+) Transcript_25031:554-1357(+)
MSAGLQIVASSNSALTWFTSSEFPGMRKRPSLVRAPFSRKVSMPSNAITGGESTSDNTAPYTAPVDRPRDKCPGAAFVGLEGSPCDDGRSRVSPSSSSGGVDRRDGLCLRSAVSFSWDGVAGHAGGPGVGRFLASSKPAKSRTTGSSLAFWRGAVTGAVTASAGAAVVEKPAAAASSSAQRPKKPVATEAAYKSAAARQRTALRWQSFAATTNASKRGRKYAAMVTQLLFECSNLSSRTRTSSSYRDESFALLAFVSNWLFVLFRAK